MRILSEHSNNEGSKVRKPSQKPEPLPEDLAGRITLVGTAL
jgi:hypothetical protein